MVTHTHEHRGHTDDHLVQSSARVKSVTEHAELGVDTVCTSNASPLRLYTTDLLVWRPGTGADASQLWLWEETRVQHGHHHAHHLQREGTHSARDDRRRV